MARAELTTRSSAEPAPSSFVIAPRSTHVRFPYDCLTHAVFAARLIRSSPPSTPGEARPETILALPRPQLLPHSADYTIIIPANVVLPRASYKLDVRLEFGVLAGATEAQICGDETSCDPLVVADMLGETVAYVGGVVEFEEGAKGRVDVGTSESSSSAQGRDGADPCSTTQPTSSHHHRSAPPLVPSTGTGTASPTTRRPLQLLAPSSTSVFPCPSSPPSPVDPSGSTLSETLIRTSLLS